MVSKLELVALMKGRTFEHTPILLLNVLFCEKNYLIKEMWPLNERVFVYRSKLPNQFILTVHWISCGEAVLPDQ